MLHARLGSAADVTVPNYQLGPGDVVEVRIYADEVETLRLRVRPNGAIEMPWLGAVAVSGATLSQVAAMVQTRLADGFYRSPQVEVDIVDYGFNRAFVVGAVANPGAQPIAAGDRLLDVVQRAGGMKPDAAGFALVLRPGAEPERVSLTAAMNGDALANIPVPRGATVYVGAREDVFVMGAVEKPGAYAIGDRATLLRAVALAGGFSPRAAETRVRIYRGAAMEPIVANVERIIEQTEEDPELRQGDLVFVPERFF